MMAAEYFTYTGGDVTRIRIHESLTVIPRRAFYGRRNIEEVICDADVETIELWAFAFCTSLRRVIMPGVKVVSDGAFCGCEALTDVQCSELEIIGLMAFRHCKSLTSINLPSAKIIGGTVFKYCTALTDVKFGNKLERIERCAFIGCRSLRRITLPLKDSMITDDNIFTGCANLEHVDLAGGIHETVAALQLEEWKNDLNEEIDSINQILPTARAGGDLYNDVGEKAIVIRTWIRAVLRKIIHYKAQHHRLLADAATTLEFVSLPKDIVIENVLPFLELPSYTFEVEGWEGEGEM
ncbi:hypothetical protein QTG54_001664 [Skeletonema marinoi]|uniref:Leucine-rich repeat domain-containing protein n=1 Tax=Skeletonema marinoi TaxID=267567 RepID=A0AAD9DH79_9STRA|nr:hypothetical protein QTG54_001664 [Skeletonema marinoi]